MKYKNKITSEVVIADSYAKQYMCEHNSNYEKVVEVKSTKVVEEKVNDLEVKDEVINEKKNKKISK